MFNYSPFHPAYNLIPILPGQSNSTFHPVVLLHCGIEDFKPHPQILCNGLKQTFEVLLLSTTSVTKKILIVKKYNSCCWSHL